MKKRTQKLIAFPVLLLLAAAALCVWLFADRLFSDADASALLMTQAISFLICWLLAIASVCMLISALSNKSFGKIALIAGLIVGTPLLIIGIILADKIRSVLSIRQITKGLYTMEYAGSVKTDELLKTDIHSVSEMQEWLRKEEFYNLPFSLDEESIGCAAFAARTPDGNVLMGRNFDYQETDALMIHTAPKNGYASYAIADLSVLGVGSIYGLISPDSLTAKLLMLAAPYSVTDGFNEAGLGAAILELSIGETHMNTGKHDLSIYTAVRILLDKCATVDEALTLLADQDIHSGIGASYHLFIEDKTGRSVVVEWLDNEMCVNALNAATNTVLTEGAHFGEGDSDSRYNTLHDRLDAAGGILTKEEAKDLLDLVSQWHYTEWSCVYDLTNFSFDLYLDTDYSQAFRFPQ